MSHPARAKKPIETLTRARVLDEALALVDEEGLSALSMRRLGARLGVEAMSLYRHVRNKADLLDALQATVLGTLEPEGGATDWRSLLGGLARSFRAALWRHPRLVPLLATHPLRAPESLATMERISGALLQAGFGATDAEYAVAAVGVYTIGHVLSETGERELDRDHPELRPAPRARAAAFRYGLDALLDGLAARARAAAKKK